MHTRKISLFLVGLGLLTATTGCKDFYDVNTDPLNPTKAELSQLLPVTQAALSTSLGMSALGLGQSTSTLVGQLASSRDVGSYNPDGGSFVNQWDQLYTNVLANNEIIIRQGTSSGNWAYVGVAQLQKAYAFSIMVDMWGDIPYSQALQGSTNIAPRFDKGSDIYLGNTSLGIQSLFSLIDEGLTNIAKTAPAITAPENPDLIFGADLAKWRRFGLALKLKLYNQVRKSNDSRATISLLAQQTQALLASPQMLSNTDDFEFKYYNSTNPDNRNLGFLADYATPSRENFIGPSFWRLMSGQGRITPGVPDAGGYAIFSSDPRRPYYFYNQKGAASTENVPYQDGRFVTVPLGSTSANANAGNSNTRTLPGLYPVGGAYDNGAGAGAGGASSSTGQGTVAQRMLTYASNKFTEAEVRLMLLNDATGAETAFRAAEQAAFDKVNTIASQNNAPAITAANVNAAINTSTAAFRNATTTEEKLRILITEKYVAGFGFGPDVYNDYRRTGYPNFAKPGEELNTQLTRVYPRRLPYSQDDLTTNPNAPQQPDLSSSNFDVSRVFWDR